MTPDEDFCFFLSWNDGALEICDDSRFVKGISKLRSVVPCVNFINAATKTCPSAQIDIFTMSNTAILSPKMSKAKLIKTYVEYIIQY